jgi:hypothetical protein
MMDYDNWIFSQADKEDMKDLTHSEQMVAGCCRSAAILFAIILGLVICALFSSCATTKYVPVIEHHTDTLIQTNVQRDSIYVHDSIMISQQGDTVRIERWHTKYVEREVHDTTYISKIDSIPKPYPVEVKVEKQLSWWQQTRLHLANILLWLLAIASVYYIIKWINLLKT